MKTLTVTREMNSFQENPIPQPNLVGKEYLHSMRAPTVIPEINDFQYHSVFQFKGFFSENRQF